MASDSYSHAPAASLSAISQTPSTTPPYTGPPPLPADVGASSTSAKTESWLFNPAYKGPNGAEMKWIPGAHMPHRQHLQLQRRASYYGYKFVPQPPSAEYLAMKLSDNPLGLINMIPGEEYYLPGQSKPSTLLLDDDTHVSNGEFSSSSTMPQRRDTDSYPIPTPLQDQISCSPNDSQLTKFHLVSSLKPTFSPKIVRTPEHYRSSSVASSSSPSLLDARYNKSGRTSAPVTPPRSSRAASPSSRAYETGVTNTSPTHAVPLLHLRRPSRVRCGYWNRRGDHLTMDGYVVYAPPALAYPAELSTYPLEKVGYQNEEGAFRPWAPRPELAESLPQRKRMPERPYESFIVYVNRDSMGSFAPRTSRRSSRHFRDKTSATTTSSVDRPSSTKRSSPAASSRAPLAPSVLSTWETTCNPNPCGLPPFDPDTSSAGGMDEWLEAFWPGYIGSMLSSEADAKEAPKDDGKTSSPLLNSAPLRVDPWDLDVRLAALSAKRQKSPTSSSSSYGSPASARSRASSWSASPGGHIPGTTRDVLEFPFGYPTSG